ncbi:MAG: hypothetical protein GDA39_00115 [Hyphomonadaceae bacterium]|nr:hypothetical protein [Hyphomonadaceae bacterium]
MEVSRLSRIVSFSYTETFGGEQEHVFDVKDITDEVIAPKDIGTSYLLAGVHDDALQNITHVVRGQDIAGLTSAQVLLQKLLGYPTPFYHHHDVIKNSDGRKLSKRNQDTAIHALRAQGLSPEEALTMAVP